MNAWEHVMEWLGFASRRPAPPREDATRSGQVYQSIQRATCAADKADKLSRDVLAQDRALTDAEVDLLGDDWKRGARDQRDR